MKKSLKVKELRKYLETMDEDAQVIIQTRYGKVSIGLIREGVKDEKNYVILDVVYDN